LAPRQPSAIALTVLSNWRGVGQRTQTLVHVDGTESRGFVQARSRPGRESWDILRLACLAHDDATWERACAEILDCLAIAAAQCGALRAFARVPSDSPHLTFLAESGFRQYASEVTHRGTLRALAEAAPTPRADVRVRRPRDAWDLFSLYCAVTPPLVRHAEGRSLKEWIAGPRATHTGFHNWGWPREVMAGEPGEVQAWIRWEPMHPAGLQLLDVLVRPESTERLGELARYGIDYLGLDADCPTVCKVREYDGRISATLVEKGFREVLRETLLVRHTAAKVTERQLLVAALRAQGLGIDLSHYRTGAEAAQHRLASSKGIERQYYDQFDRTERASYYR